MKLFPPKWRLCRKTTLGQWKPVKQEEIDEDGPQIIIIDDDMTGSLNRGAVAGRIDWKDDIDDTTRYMYLRGDKLLRIRMFGIKIPMWVHYKREAYSYPHAPKQDSEHTAKTMIGIQQDYKNLESARALRNADLWKKWMVVIAIGVGIVAAVYVGLPYVIQILGVKGLHLPWM